MPKTKRDMHVLRQGISVKELWRPAVFRADRNDENIQDTFLVDGHHLIDELTKITDIVGVPVNWLKKNGKITFSKRYTLGSHSTLYANTIDCFFF